LSQRDIQEDDEAGKLVGCAYFFFNLREAHLQTPSGMLESIISQLVDEPRKVTDSLETQYSSKDASVTSLLEILISTLEKYSAVYVILDALDEAVDQKLLMGIIVVMDGWKTQELRLLITSRKEVGIEEGLRRLDRRDLSEVSIGLETSLVDADIQQWVQTQLLDDKTLQKWNRYDDLRELIISKMDHAKGM
jgi:hypothetical protein